MSEQVKVYDVRAQPPALLATVTRRDGRLVVDGPEWAEALINSPATYAGVTVEPSDEDFLVVLAGQFSGSALRAEYRSG